MSRLRVDKFARVTAGLGLLVLLAAQEKLGPWALTPPPASEASAKASDPPDTPADGDADVPEQSTDDHKPKKISLQFVVPDAAAPRWAASWHQAELRLSGGARDGVVACGQRDSIGPGAAANDALPGWHALQLDLAPLEDAVLALAPVPTDPQRLLTVITRTGPPHWS